MRDQTQDCVFSIFDLHDCWHLLSAVALALFTMFLLDIRVNSWARKAGIQVIAELPADRYMPVSDLDTSVDELRDLKVRITRTTSTTSCNSDLEAASFSEGMLKP